MRAKLSLAVMSSDIPDGRQRRPGNILLGCVLVLTASIAVLMGLGAALAILIAISTPSDHPYVMAFVGGGISAAISGFFIMVSRRIYAEMRGRPSPYLIPPWLAVPLAFLI